MSENFHALAQFHAQRIYDACPVLDYHKHSIAEALETAADAVMLKFEHPISYMESNPLHTTQSLEKLKKTRIKAEEEQYKKSKDEVGTFVRTEIIGKTLELMSLYFTSGQNIETLNAAIAEEFRTLQESTSWPPFLNQLIRDCLTLGLIEGFRHLGVEDRSININNHVVGAETFDMALASLENKIRDADETLPPSDENTKILSAYKQGLIAFQHALLQKTKVNPGDLPVSYLAAYRKMADEKSSSVIAMNPHAINRALQLYAGAFFSYSINGNITRLIENYHNGLRDIRNPPVVRAFSYMMDIALGHLGVDVQALQNLPSKTR